MYRVLGVLIIAAILFYVGTAKVEHPIKTGADMTQSLEAPPRLQNKSYPLSDLTNFT